MNIEVTVKHFEGELSHFDCLIPSIKSSMEQLIYTLSKLDGAPISLENINTIHFVDD